MKGEKHSDFSFLGKRKYIQGATLLDFALRCIWEEKPSVSRIRVRQFTIHREVEKNVVLTPSLTDPKESAAEIRFDGENEAESAFLLPSGPPIEKRTEDKGIPVEIIGTDMDFSGEGRVGSVQSFKDLIEAIVELNKRLHLQAAVTSKEDPRVRVAYFRDLEATRDFEPGPLSMGIQKRTQRDFAGLRYTLSDARYSVGNAEGRLTLCFSFKAKD
jgi:hypothetical protein